MNKKNEKVSAEVQEQTIQGQMSTEQDSVKVQQSMNETTEMTTNETPKDMLYKMPSISVWGVGDQWISTRKYNYKIGMNKDGWFIVQWQKGYDKNNYRDPIWSKPWLLPSYGEKMLKMIAKYMDDNITVIKANVADETEDDQSSTSIWGETQIDTRKGGYYKIGMDGKHYLVKWLKGFENYQSKPIWSKPWFIPSWDKMVLKAVAQYMDENVRDRKRWE